ncbi:MAG: hypothetical protein ACK47U_10580, partial [Verrucomicrobiota bacterium]
LPKSKQSAAAIVMSGLQQRLYSSPKAFSRTLRKHKETMTRVWAGEVISEQELGGEAASVVAGGGADYDSDRAGQAKYGVRPHHGKARTWAEHGVRPYHESGRN